MATHDFRYCYSHPTSDQHELSHVTKAIWRHWEITQGTITRTDLAVVGYVVYFNDSDLEQVCLDATHDFMAHTAQPTPANWGPVTATPGPQSPRHSGIEDTVRIEAKIRDQCKALMEDICKLKGFGYWTTPVKVKEVVDKAARLKGEDLQYYCEEELARELVELQMAQEDKA